MNSLPSVTVLIPTFCRTRRLAEAIYSALNQDYAGKIDVLVLNDYNKQTLRCVDPRVEIVNVERRVGPLSAKRDMMLLMASGEWIAFLDDDDLLMPWHLRQIKPESAATLPQSIFTVDDVGNWTCDRVLGGIHFLVRRPEALSVGFKSGLDVGEDNAFRNAVLAAYKNSIAQSPVPSYVWRRFLPGVGHISHMVKVDASPDVDRFIAAADERVANGLEPKGEVVITPRWEQDYWEEVQRRFPDEMVPRRKP
jgi:glycosyltransferase involved in cell wall biosynthesis